MRETYRLTPFPQEVVDYMDQLTREFMREAERILLKKMNDSIREIDNSTTPSICYVEL